MKKSMSGVCFKLFILVGLLSCLVACKGEIYSFQPIVVGPTHTNIADPEFSWGDNLVEGEIFRYEFYQIVDGASIKKGEGTTSESKLKISTILAGETLAEGKYLFVIWKERTVDDVVVESLKTEHYFTVVLSLPDLPVVTPRVSVYDTADGKKVVNTRELNWVWTLPEGVAKFLVRVGDAGEWIEKKALDRSYSYTAEVDGEVVFYVRSVDQAGNITPEKDATFSALLVDTFALIGPSITATFPTPVVIGDVSKTNVDKPSFTWLVSETVEYGASEIYRCQLIASESPNLDKLITYDRGKNDELKYIQESPLKDGKYTFFCQSIDPRGNPSLFSFFSFIIDTTPPEVPILTVDNVLVESILGEGRWGWTSSPDAVKVGYKFYLPGATSAQESFIEDMTVTSYTAEFTEFSPQGRYLLEVRAYDDLGNVSSWSERSLEFRTTESSVPVLSVNGSIVKVEGEKTFHYLNKLRPQLSWVVSDSTIEEFSWYLFEGVYDSSSTLNNGAGWVSNALLQGYTFPEDLTLIDNLGSYTFLLRTKKGGVWDGVNEYAICYFKIDLAPPAKPVIIGSNIIGIDKATGKGYPQWSWSFDTADTGGFRYQVGIGDIWTVLEGVERVSFRERIGLVGSVGSGTSYTFQIQACDFLGNWSDSAIFVTSISTSVPDGPIVTPAVAVSANRKPTFNWTFLPGLTPEAIWVKIGSEPNPDGGGGLGSDWDFYSATPLDSGQNSYTVTGDMGVAGTETTVVCYVMAKYSGDAIRSSSGNAISIVDLMAPSAPRIIGDVQTGSKQPRWEILPRNILDHGGFKWKINGDVLVDTGWTEVDESVKEVISPNLLALGKHIFYLKASDPHGNWSEATTFVTEIVAGPSVPSLRLATIADVTFDGNKTNTNLPTFVWNHDDGASFDAFRYRFDPIEEWVTVGGSYGTENTFVARYPVSQGDLICEVQVLKKMGSSLINSESAKVSFFVDSVAPSTPFATYPVPVTSDTTPEITWGEVEDASSYSYELIDKATSAVVESGTLSADKTSIILGGAGLAIGSYQFKIRAEDDLRNSSGEGLISFEISSEPGVPDPSVPSQIIVTSVSKGESHDSIRIEWVKDRNAMYHTVYRFTEEQIKAGNFNVATAVKVVEEVDLSAPDSGGLVDSNKGVYYDNTANGLGYGNYYYAVSGSNDAHKAGLSSSLNSAEIRERVRGFRFGIDPAQKFLAGFSPTGMRLQMHDLVGAEKYYVSRLVSSSVVSDPATSVGWEYYSSADSWVAESGATLVSERKGLTSSTEDIVVGDWDLNKYYYFRFFAENTTSKESSTIQEEGILTGEYYYSPIYYSTVCLPFPTIDDSWFIVGQNDPSYEGKIPVTINIPDGHQGSFSNMQFQVSRTYGYGGGYRGSNNGVGTVGVAGADGGAPHGSGDPAAGGMGWNRYPLNPNPNDSEREKTIVAYTFTGDRFKNNSYVCKDTLYDTNEDNEKLFACLPKADVGAVTHIYDDGRHVHSWFLLTDAQIAAYAAKQQTWVKVIDPDGTPSEHEWHYLLWDWAIRKQLGSDNVGYKSAAFSNFKFEEMVTCKYSIKLVALSDDSKNSTTGEKTGVPALTPREFAHLAELFRQISFYHQEATLMNAITGITGFGAGVPSFGTVSGTQSGSIVVSNSGSAIPPIYAKVATPSGISDLAGCSIKLQDGAELPLTIRRSSDNGGWEYMRGFMDLVTPVYSGRLYLDINLKSGTFWAVVGGGTLKVTYGKRVMYDVVDQISSAFPEYKSYYLANEIAQTVYPNYFIKEGGGQWNGRYTDINFVYKGTKYPGFKTTFSDPDWYDNGDHTPYWWNNSWLP